MTPPPRHRILTWSFLVFASIALVGCGTRSTVYFATSYPENSLKALRIGSDTPTTLVEGKNLGALAFDFSTGQLLTEEARWSGGILRRNTDGTLVERLVANPQARDFAVDFRAGHLYWAAVGSPIAANSTIERVDLADGSNRISLAGPELRNISSVEIDPRHGTLYWTGGHSQGRLWRSKLDGTGREQIGPDFAIRQIAVDPVAGRLYFDDAMGSRSPRSLWWSRLDGSEAAPLIPLDGASISDLHFDPKSRRLYWSESGGTGDRPRIRRSNPRGGAVETVFEQSSRVTNILHLAVEEE